MPFAAIKITFCTALCLSAALVQGQETSPSPETVAYFEQHVQPLLVSRCLECHGEKREGDFDLRTRATALLGSESGIVLVSGDTKASKLHELIYDEKMPPKTPLTDEEVDILGHWIEGGLYYPDEPLVGPDDGTTDREEWWSVSPLALPSVPDVSGVTNPVDAFIRQSLTERGLTPSPQTDPRTLIRRLNFDLHGLPPTPEAIRNFVRACHRETGSSGTVGDAAYAELVDELLASPRYGERWARHWLDVAHYGETHGFDKDQRRDNAWPYRDYVIQSLNDGKPYTDFVREQIAGDVLYPADPQGVIAVGFLAAGPWDLVGQSEVREGTIEKKRVRNLDRDDIVTNVFNTFQSTTVQCARCHNHKFDPIDRRDYYELQSVFSGIDRADREYESVDAAARRSSLMDKISRESASLEATKLAIAEQLPEEYAKISKSLERLERKHASLQPDTKIDSPTNGYHSVVAETAEEHHWVQIDLEKPVTLEELRLIPARPTDYKDTPGFGFPLRLTVAVSASHDADDFVLLLDAQESDYPNPGDEAVSFALKSQLIQRIRIDAYKLWERDKDYAFALAEVEAISEGMNVARDATVTASSSIDFGRWHTRNLVDGYDSRNLRPSHDGATSEERAEVEAEIAALEREGLALVQLHVEKPLLDEQSAQESSLVSLNAELATLPAPSKVYSVRTFERRPVFDLYRGSEASPGEEVQPEALSVIPVLPTALADARDHEGATRADLAEWIVHPENVLTWRSIVNRVWQYHFGHGLVDTPNDFGRAGSLPTHPRLLDWLAATFRDSGSLKDLHRMIVSSATYRQASQYHAQNAAIDGNNQFLWRMNIRKLDAESVHDSILSMSGKLDLTMGGPGYEAFNYTHDHSPRYDFLGKDGPEVWRRSIYRFIVRSVPDPYFEALDCADPSMSTPVRIETLTAPQALAMLNDAFVLNHARHTAERFAGEALKQPITEMHESALGRLPSESELITLTQFTEQHGLAGLARLLFNTNEFIFVD